MSASKYRELRKLGSGGAGYVALAVDADGRHVAIKRPHAHLFDDAQALSAFRREIAVVSHLRHENVVTLYETEPTAAEDGAVPQLILEYVDGLTLADLVKTWKAEGRKDPGAALSIVRDVARGLSAVHELTGETGEPLALVHRDVSPQNILVARQGIAKLTDFGLARSLARGDRSTTGGVLKGKAGYLAPEYIRGAPIDARVDIFALGIVLWEALVRERLFGDENEAALLQKILTTAPPKVAERGVNLGAAQDDVQMILDRATSRSPSQRYATAREMADDIDRTIATHQLWADRERVAASFGENLSTTLNTRASVDTKSARTKRVPTRRSLALIALAVVSSLALFAATMALRESPAPPSAVVPPVPSASIPIVDATQAPVLSAAAAQSLDVAPSASTASSSAPPQHRPARDPKAPRRNPY